MRKKLGLPSAVATGVGLIVASSCLLTLGQGAGFAGTAFIIPMFLAFVINVMAGCSIAELNALMPNLSGGLAQYTFAGLGPFAAIVSMVGGYAVCNSFMSSAEASVLGITLVELMGVDISPNVISIAFTVLLMLVNLRGVDIFAKIQNIVAYSMIGSIMILGLIGMFALGTGHTIEQEFMATHDWGTIMGLTSMGFFLFIGIEYVVPLASDMKKPKKDIPRAMFLSLFIIMIIQTFMVFGFKNYVPWADLAASNAPHVLYGVSLLGKPGEIWLGIATVLAAVSTLNTGMNGIPRIVAGMSRNNMLPKVFSKTNRYNAPWVGVLTIGGISMLIQATGISTASQVTFIIMVGCMFFIVSYIISHFNVMVLRKRLPKAPRSYKTPLFPLPQLLGIAGSIYMVLNIDPDPARKHLIWLLTGTAFALFSIYAAFWIKYKMKLPLFKAMPIEKIMAAEHRLYGVATEKPATATDADSGNDDDGDTVFVPA
jgi:amino acid transporter